MRLLPHDASFFAHFEQQGKKTVEGCRAFLDMVDNPSALESRAERVKQIEHECDEITHAVVEGLHKTFITPFDRNDIYRLITKMDDIMDYVEAGAERIALYEIREFTPEVVDLADTLWRASKDVEEALNGLRDLKNPKRILEKCVDINRLENEADAILRRSVARLFKEEKDPIVVIKWKEIYENLEMASDRCEDVANIIEGVILEHA